MSASRTLQLTLAILKPDLMLHPAKLQAVKKKIIQEKFWVIKWKILHWNREEAEQFYREHKGRFFYQRLTSFMSSGPIMPLILARENAINHWRTLMGPTKSTKAKHTHPNSIRGLYGLTDTRNAAHGSDSEETALKEMKNFFPDFDQNYWLNDNAKKFQTGCVIFDESQEIHKVIPDTK